MPKKHIYQLRDSRSYLIFSTIFCILITVVVAIFIVSYQQWLKKHVDIESRGGTESQVIIDHRYSQNCVLVTKVYNRGPIKYRKLGYRKNVEILQRMINESESNHVPKLLDWNDSKLSVTMSYCGEPLTSKNTPPNIVRQLQEIRYDLFKAGVTWIDPALENFVVDSNGKISIVDFGYRTYDVSDHRAFSRGPLDIQHVLKRLREK